jgi:hypothetical protein
LSSTALHLPFRNFMLSGRVPAGSGNHAGENPSARSA